MTTRGVQEPEWTPTGVLTNFKNRSGVGVDFLKEGPEPESFHEYKVSFLITDCYYRRFFCTKHVIMQSSNVKNYFTGSLKI